MKCVKCGGVGYNFLKTVYEPCDVCNGSGTIRKKQMNKLKDMKYLDTTIRVWKIREVWKTGKGCRSYKDKLKCVKSSSFRGSTETCFPDTSKGNRELIEFIKYELNIQ